MRGALKACTFSPLLLILVLYCARLMLTSREEQSLQNPKVAL